MLGKIGTAGTVLSIAILAASLLLRLATVFDVHGQPFSVLPSGVEDFTRLIHRVAASAMGLLTALAAALCWIRRRDAAHAIGPVMGMVVATAILAAIGPLTPGYRYAAVTVLNVTCGVMLTMACWWLRESATRGGHRKSGSHPLLYTTLVVLLFHVATGAAASALGPGRIGWPALVHIGTAALATIFLGGTLWESRTQTALKGIAGAMGLMLALQLMLGVASVVAAPLPLAVSLAHALLVPFMLAGLVSMAVRQTGHSP